MTDFALTIATRRGAICLGLAATLNLALPGAASAAADEISKRFRFLAGNGNSNCSQSFLDSIASMPDTARLQGSCCGPMDLHRYREQIAGLQAHMAIAEIPPDPYDIEAGHAKRLLAAYGIQLGPEQQKAYDQAMDLSSEKGPCCCRCWRWHVYGGLGKLLVRDRGFGGPELAHVWDLSDGCGGADHVH
ncbi:hypothetical protein [Taklimakanibacter lacteus]|uniref:hypothetical protein n=1 Tax=Taklimakanibacter lacteus TaxID=2268456 RepID=UPI000E66C874